MARFLYIAGTFLLLTACGFEPVYAPRGDDSAAGLSAAVLAEIAVDPIPERSGQILQVALEDGLHPDGTTGGEGARYRLKTELQEVKQPIIIEQTGRITRFNLVHLAKFTINSPEGGAPVYQGSARRISSYNVSLSDFSTFEAERDARERGLQALAQDMLMRIAAGFHPQTQREGTP